MPRISLHGLELLVAIGNHGSISAAARALGYSQPTVSAAIDRLERTMKMDLIERSSRGSLLTNRGRIMAGWAQEVLDASNRFESNAAMLRDDGSERLLIAASMTIAENLLPGWLTEWRRRRQGGESLRAPRVELLVRNSDGVMRALLDGDAALGFVEGEDVWNGLRGVTIGHDELVVVVGRGNPWASRGKPVTPAELAAAPLVLREQGSGTRQVLERALNLAGVPLPQTLPQFGSTAAVKAAVTQGDSVAVISELAVTSELSQGSLVRLSTSGLQLRRTLRMVTRVRGHPSATVQELATVIAQSRASTQRTSPGP